jgi:NAD(P)-dependent dehydrogenase (short-subunit alcohol dehydrogenase family)
MTESEVREAFEVNAIAAIAILQEGAKRMPDGGAVINITSRLAAIGVPGMAIYSATKVAAAVELAPRNVRLNAVAPGMTRTPLYVDWLAQQDDPAMTEQEGLPPRSRSAGSRSPPMSRRPSASSPRRRPPPSPA